MEDRKCTPTSDDTPRKGSSHRSEGTLPHFESPLAKWNNPLPRAQGISMGMSELISPALKEANANMDGLMTPNVLESQAQLQSIAEQISAAFTPSISALQETMSSIAGVSEQLATSYTGLSESALDRMDSLRESIDLMIGGTFASLRESVQALAALWPEIDWDSIEEEYRTWGRYGWVGFELLDSDVLPESQKEADAIARRIMPDTVMEEILNELEGTIRKRQDLAEAITLYRERRYKSCAMMTFSLIECELFKNAKKPDKGRRQLRSAYKRTIDGEAPTKSIELMAIGALAALEHLFMDANDFDRTRETDINRNFLMHGMRYAPVRQHHCKKLFAMLRATAAVTNC